jgi:hypothetical protein
MVEEQPPVWYQIYAKRQIQAMMEQDHPHSLPSNNARYYGEWLERDDAPLFYLDRFNNWIDLGLVVSSIIISISLVIHFGG